MSIFSIDQLTPIYDSVVACIVQERERYAKIYEAIETYTQEHQLILGGTLGVNTLIGKPKGLDDYYYELYTEHPFVAANNMCNDIAAVADRMIVRMQTAIPYGKYNIMADGRNMISVYGLESGITKVIGPVESDMLLLPPEIQLINIYRTLYSPNKADEWETALHDENALFDQMIKSADKFGGGHNTSDLRKHRDNLQHSILKNFVNNNKHCVLLGEHALYMNDPDSYKLESPIVQIISARPVSEDVAVITKLSPGYPVTHNTKELKILQDFRLTRTIIRVGDRDSGEQKEVMYVYNAAHYDLIPYNRYVVKDGFIQVGNPFVLLRFLLIDFWIIRLIHAAGKMDDNYKNMRLQSIRNKVLMLRSQLSSGDVTTINELHTSDRSRIRIFQDKNYIGKYENEDIAQKEASKNAKKYPYYYPQEYYRKNNEYRIVSQS
jgi:hypothetical protein